jgi:hypothetical protein
MLQWNSKTRDPLYMPIIKLYYLFLTNPKKNYSLTKSSHPIKIFINVLVITYGQILLVSFIPFQSNHSAQAQITMPANLWLLIFIPLYEELLFRLPLKISSLHIYTSLSLLISSITLLIINTVFNDPITLLNYYIAAFGIALPIFLIFKMFKSKRIEQLLQKNYNSFFYVSILLFTSLHFCYVPLSLSAVLIYLIYGYSLSFLRISTHFIYALFLHIILMLPFLFSTLYASG